ncbi:hypothetical protein QFC24_002124 [Naganishia onofrii]|uniref:Uncharacterized protein n=1 Tax=Naganishia onofrii TaxID=1851511 RepID=A0ACC2XTQ0_9TREE|nr:hypothetical protein QFC24_002124 [Naganishia onofrii]
MFPAVARTGLRSAGASMRPMAFRAERQVLGRQTRGYSADRVGDKNDSKSKLVFRFGLKGESFSTGSMALRCRAEGRFLQPIDIPIELYPMLVVVVAACAGGSFALARQFYKDSSDFRLVPSGFRKKSE